MKKVYKKLTSEQKQRNVIFSSQLISDDENINSGVIHEVLSTGNDKENCETIARLKDDKFFNNSPFKYNLIRQ
jgi:hypothetical protein